MLEIDPCDICLWHKEEKCLGHIKECTSRDYYSFKGVHEGEGTAEGLGEWGVVGVP